MIAGECFVCLSFCLRFDFAETGAIIGDDGDKLIAARLVTAAIFRRPPLIAAARSLLTVWSSRSGRLRRSDTNERKITFGSRRSRRQRRQFENKQRRRQRAEMSARDERLGRTGEASGNAHEYKSALVGERERDGTQPDAAFFRTPRPLLSPPVHVHKQTLKRQINKFHSMNLIRSDGIAGAFQPIFYFTRHRCKIRRAVSRFDSEKRVVYA